MDITAFPNGISSFGIPVLPGVDSPTTGSVFFVDSSTGNNAYTGKEPSQALATLDYAIGKCTNNKGDIIIVMPNHAETVTGVGGITADVAGITILGLGTYNQRPNFLMDGADTVTFAVSAADVTVKNCVFTAGHADVAVCFNITAKGCTLVNVEFADNTTDENWLNPIAASSTTNNACDGLKVVGCTWLSPDAAGTQFITAAGDLKGLVVRDNVVVHEGTDSALIKFATGKDMKYGFVAWNFLSHKMTANELLVNIDTTGTNNSGIIAHNRVGHADVTTSHDLGIDSLGCRLFDNLSVSTNALSGLLLPAADADS